MLTDTTNSTPYRTPNTIIGTLLAAPHGELGSDIKLKLIYFKDLGLIV